MRALRWGICLVVVGVLCGTVYAWQRHVSNLPKVHRHTLTKTEEEQALECIKRLLPKQRDGSLKGRSVSGIAECLKLATMTITRPDRTEYYLDYEGEYAANVEGAGCLVITVSKDSGMVCQTDHLVAEW